MCVRLMKWLMLIALIVTACAPAAPASSAIEDVRPDGQEVVVWHSYEGSLRAALLTQIDEFNATNPWHIVVVPEYHGQNLQLKRELKDAISTGSTPDLAILAPADAYALSDAIVRLQRYVDNSRYGLSSDEVADMFSAMLDTTRDPKQGTLIGFPLGGEGVVLVHNADRLAAHNYLTPPDSWPLFSEVCRSNTVDTTGDNKPDVFGFGFNPRADFAAAWMISRGGSLLSDDGLHTTFNSDEGVKTLQTLQDTASSGCFYPTTDEDQINDFARGKVAMIFALTTQLPDIFNAVQARGGFRWGVSPVPYGKRDPSLTISGPAWTMLRSTPAKQLAAWLFIKWFSDTAQTVGWSQLTGLLPLRKSAGAGLANEFTTNAGFKVAFDLLSVAKAQPDIPAWGNIAELLIHAVNAAVAGNDPTQLLNDAAKNADALLNQ
ncbi:MAG TPA: extracellular solute-binding protein [Anaerolineae bacterium]|nr:extracellular solute-binding protein [Anaerolineae bacterium]